MLKRSSLGSFGVEETVGTSSSSKAGLVSSRAPGLPGKQQDLALLFPTSPLTRRIFGQLYLC